MPTPPQLIVLAGPNGAGKSTLAPHLLRDTLGINEFVNADKIAEGLSGYSPEGVAVEAGKIMLQRLYELMENGRSFAIETTLSGRNWLKLFHRAKEIYGYEITIHYLWIDSWALAVDRVNQRTHHGGHHIPENTVKRRYRRSITNFLIDYKELADVWTIHDTSKDEKILLIATKENDNEQIIDPLKWDRIHEDIDHD